MRAADLQDVAPARLVRQPVFESGQTADAIVAEARREADDIRARAQAGADAARRRAAEDAAKETRDQAAALIALLAQARESWQRAMEPTLIELATVVAERILHRELQTDPQAVAELAGHALLAGRSPWAGPLILLRASPQDADAIGPWQAELSGLLADGQTLRIEFDSSIPRYGCRVETAAGSIDGTIAAQLRVLREALTKAERESRRMSIATETKP